MKHAFKKAIVTAILSLIFLSTSKAGEFNRAWFSPNSSIVLDAYEFTPIDWSIINKNKRLTGFINKASDGLSPTSRCRKGDELCGVKWRRYSATKELYHTRKVLAKTLGLKWGAYHLGRPGNPIEQAQHFLDFAKPADDELIALDIEHNDPKKWMSLEDAEIFARFIKIKTGRYPVLYTNHYTSKFIAANRDKLRLLSRLNLWYARYKPNMKGAFPMGNWNSYTIWQFSSMVNCNKRSCPWRIIGAGPRIDVNVVAMSPSKLKKAWPFAKLKAKVLPTPPRSDVPMAANVDPIVVASRRSANSAMPIEVTTFPKWRPGAVIVKREVPIDDDQRSIDVAQSFEFNLGMPMHNSKNMSPIVPRVETVIVAEARLVRLRNDKPVANEVAQSFESNLGMPMHNSQNMPRIETIIAAEARRVTPSNDNPLAYEVAHYFESNLGMPLFNSSNTAPKGFIIEAEVVRNPGDYPGAL